MDGYNNSWEFEDDDYLDGEEFTDGRDAKEKPSVRVLNGLGYIWAWIQMAAGKVWFGIKRVAFKLWNALKAWWTKMGPYNQKAFCWRGINWLLACAMMIWASYNLTSSWSALTTFVLIMSIALWILIVFALARKTEEKSEKFRTMLGCILPMVSAAIVWGRMLIMWLKDSMAMKKICEALALAEQAQNNNDIAALNAEIAVLEEAAEKRVFGFWVILVVLLVIVVSMNLEKIWTDNNKGKLNAVKKSVNVKEITNPNGGVTVIKEFTE